MLTLLEDVVLQPILVIGVLWWFGEPIYEFIRFVTYNWIF